MIECAFLVICTVICNKLIFVMVIPCNYRHLCFFRIHGRIIRFDYARDPSFSKEDEKTLQSELKELVASHKVRLSTCILFSVHQRKLLLLFHRVCVGGGGGGCGSSTCAGFVPQTNYRQNATPFSGTYTALKGSTPQALF